MIPHRRRSAFVRLALLTAGVFTAASLVWGPASWDDDGRNPDPPPVMLKPPGPTPTPAPPEATAPADTDRQRPAFGAFLDSEAAGIARMQQFSRWLGGTEVRVGHTYLPGDVWSNIEGGHGFLDSWAEWRRAKADRMLVLNVPLMEHNEADVSDTAVRRLLRRAAAGAYDEHFRVLAQRLVALGATDTILVLGWEMNGTTYTHRCGPDPQDWKTYWNRIVAAMRAVPGQHFRFDFAPNRGQDAIGWTACYPGDASVDIVGMDSYDQPSGESFYDQVTEPFGLQAQVEFAAAHHKAISYPEWGMFRNGDDPDYMSLMLTWIARHRPLYQTITDYCPHGVWQCTGNPRASAVYRAVMSTVPAPQPTPGPTAPVPTAPVPTAPVPPVPAQSPTPPAH
jgi:hypothetical protein